MRDTDTHTLVERLMRQLKPRASRRRLGRRRSGRGSGDSACKHRRGETGGIGLARSTHRSLLALYLQSVSALCRNAEIWSCA